MSDHTFMINKINFSESGKSKEEKREQSKFFTFKTRKINT